MSKINKYYESLFAYLVVKNFPFARKLDAYFHADEIIKLKIQNNLIDDVQNLYRNGNPENTDEEIDTEYNIPRYSHFVRIDQLPYHTWKKLFTRQSFLETLHPFIDMRKDFLDTFKPYKSTYHVLRDFIQPIRGLGNIMKSIAHFIAAPLLFIGNTIRYACRRPNSLATFASNMKLNVSKTVHWLIDGVSSAIRGLTQIITTPFTWLKMAFRGIITAVKGAPKIEANSGIKKILYDKGGVLQKVQTKYFIQRQGISRISSPIELPHLNYIRNELARKYTKALKRGQSTIITTEQVKPTFATNLPISYRDQLSADYKCIMQFFPKSPAQNQTQNANVMPTEHTPLLR